MPFMTVTVRDARARLSELLNQVADGGQMFAISRWGVDQRALLVPADRYQALEKKAAALDELAQQVQPSLAAVLELADKLSQAAEAQRIEVGTLRDLAERFADQIRDADPVQARSARQEASRIAGRVDAQGRTVRDGLEDIRTRIRAIQRQLQEGASEGRKQKAENR
jgi:prevent-host-death family protein